MRKTLVSQDITAGYHPAATVLDPCFSIHHEEHEGHEERTTGLEKRPGFKRLLPPFVLFMSFVVVYFG
ncbi:MAG: hypothetical protein ACE5HC_07265 [Candidatus Binatia bacterium]